MLVLPTVPEPLHTKDMCAKFQDDSLGVKTLLINKLTLTFILLVMILTSSHSILKLLFN